MTYQKAKAPTPTRSWLLGRWPEPVAHVKANTKSEARAKFKKEFGRLPSGANIREVVDR